MTENTLDQILPVPKLEELKNETVEKLRKKGFVITNYNAGGVFNMLLMIPLQIYLEMKMLLRIILKQMFVSTASGIWLREKGADYSKKIKEAQKAWGRITITAAAQHDAITIPKGTIFKTDQDITGRELRFFSLDSVVIPKTEMETTIEVEAEKPGTDYNVPAGKIHLTLTHLEGVTAIENQTAWITREGTDLETDEQFRSRILNSWSELAAAPTAAKYKSIAEAVPGVLYADVNQLHPRGQGTVDIIITSTAGAATDKLLKEVAEAVETVRGDYDNLLVKSAAAVYQDLTLLVIMPRLGETEGVRERAILAVENYFAINTDRTLNELILLDILYQVKQEIPEAKNIRLLKPEEDVKLDKGQVICLGAMDISVTREE